MSNNGRKVSTDALETLGTIIDDTQKRDAIHLAVEPVIAATTLTAGQHVRIRDGFAHPAYDDDGQGIVDPFLPRPVREGERFWFVMYPRMVTSLRHVWSHPDFPDVTSATIVASDGRSQAEAWIRRYAAQLDVGYNDLITCAGEFLDDGEYMYRGGVLEGVSTSDEFWVQYAALTGREVGNPGNFFSCSC